MMMTEKEAAEKWCPHTTGGEDNENRWYKVTSAAGAPYPRCIASQCSQWRWPAVYLAWVNKATGQIAPAGTLVDRTVMEQRHVMSERGYCGLAGKPEDA